MFGQPTSGGGGGLFGSAPAGGSSMFGGGASSGYGSNAGGTSMFGGGSAGGSLFGAPATGGSSSLFGGQGGGSSLFGGGGNGPSSSLFGGTGTSNGGGGMFGGAQSAGGLGLGASAGGGVFGGGASAAGGSSMFGTGVGSTGLFGGAGSNRGGSTSLFNGGSMGGSAFGQSAGFGSGLLSAQPGYGTGFGMQQQQQMQQRIIDEESDHLLKVQEARGAIPKWYKELVQIQAAYRVCQFSRFQTFMYEVAPTAPDIHRQSNTSLALVEQTKNARREQFRQQIPWLEENKREWQQFEDQNPDPANWIPCPVIGIDALKARVEAQQKYTKDQLDSVDQERNRTWLTNAAADIQALDQSIERCRREHAKVRHQLVVVLGRLERIQARHQGVKGPRSPAEILFHERLEKLRRLLDDPRGCKTRLLDIERRLTDLLPPTGSASVAPTTLSITPAQSSKGEVSAEQRKRDEESEQRNKQLLAFLEEQRRSMATVMEVLRRDSRDVRVMRERLMN